MHGKVSITRFNVPAGDTFQAISLAGGHVISIQLLQAMAFQILSQKKGQQHRIENSKDSHVSQHITHQIVNFFVVCFIMIKYDAECTIISLVIKFT